VKAATSVMSAAPAGTSGRQASTICTATRGPKSGLMPKRSRPTSGSTIANAVTVSASDSVM